MITEIVQKKPLEWGNYPRFPADFGGSHTGTLVLSTSAEYQWRITEIKPLDGSLNIVPQHHNPNRMQLYDFEPCQKVTFTSQFLDTVKDGATTDEYTFEVLKFFLNDTKFKII